MTTSSPRQSPTPGAREETQVWLGRYRLERAIGSGVHAAYDTELERRVALKVRHTTTVTASQRLPREARAMAKLSHPNVMTVHDAGTVDGRDFVAMELVDETLAEWLCAERRNRREIVAAFRAAGRGLAHDPSRLQTQNILRGFGGRILDADFGLAHEAVSQDPGPPSRSRDRVGSTSRRSSGANYRATAPQSVTSGL